MKPKKAFAALCELNRSVQAIIEAARVNESKADDPWELAFSHVFNASVSGRIADLCKFANLKLEYYDPDTTYEEDVRAYADALNDLVTHHTPFFEALPA